MAAIIRALAGIQAILSACAVYTSVITIRKLQGYEPATKKAAEYTNKAGHELHKTRTTHASGALSTVASLITSVALCLSSAPTSSTFLAFSALNIGTTFFARSHLAAHWGNKWQVPGVRDFSDAIKNSKWLGMQLAYLSMGWTVVTLALGISFIR